jgi:hypothetical protein
VLAGFLTLPEYFWWNARLFFLEKNFRQVDLHSDSALSRTHHDVGDLPANVAKQVRAVVPAPSEDAGDVPSQEDLTKLD